MDDLKQKIKNKSAKVAVVGLGYVGLPVACLLAKAGFSVLGINRGREKVDLINSGKSPIEGKEPGLEQLIKEALGSKRLRATTDYTGLNQVDVVLVAVETPVDKTDRVPKYEALQAALTSVAKNMKRGTLVIIESTIAPGTMKNVVAPLLKKESGLQIGKDFYLGHCPERVTPGRLLLQLENWPRVVGGFDRETAQLAVLFYKKFVKGELDATTYTTAEIVKTEENTFRDTLIAQANALALLCEYFGVDVYEVVRLIKKDPAHTAYLYPGAGVGGHCLPKDGYLKVALARKDAKDQRIGPSVRLVELVREINDLMPKHVVSLLKEAFKEKKISLKRPKISILGYAYLQNSDDTRNSPTESLVKILSKENFEISIHDPYVKDYRVDLDSVLAGSDAMVVMVAHDEYKRLSLGQLKNLMRTPVLIDGRNIFDKEKAQKAGFIYKGVGNV